MVSEDGRFGSAATVSVVALRACPKGPSPLDGTVLDEVVSGPHDDLAAMGAEVSIKAVNCMVCAGVL